MESLVDEIFEVEYSDLDSCISKFPINKRFGLVVRLNGIKYEFLLNLKEYSDTILVLAPPAIEGTQLKKFCSRPYFSRQSWDFNESTIYFEDPTRYVYSLKSGWGIGTPNEWFLDNIKNIILKIVHFFEISDEKLIFFGSSSGGFTSIQLATLVKDSLAIADCPQTDLRKWHYYWKDLKRTIFNQFSDDEIDSKFDYRISVIDNMIKENYIPKLLFISTLNENDIDSQTVPFIQQLKNLPFKNYSFSRIKIFINPVDFHGPIYKNDAFNLLENIGFFRNKKDMLSRLHIQENNISKTFEFRECIFYDDSKDCSYKNLWQQNGTSSIVRSADGTVMTGNKWDSINLKVDNSINIEMGNYIFKFDVINIIGSNARLNVYDGTSHQILLSTGHYEVEITDKIYVVKDNKLVDIMPYDKSSVYVQLNFNINNDGVQLKFKNVRLYTI